MSGNKKNENKFMAMLERRGIIRKVDHDEDLSSDLPASADLINKKPLYDDDLRALLDLSNEEAPSVQRQPVQPVPGMIKPVFSSDTDSQDQSGVYKSAIPEFNDSTFEITAKEPKRSPDVTLDIEEPVSSAVTEPVVREEPPVMSSERTSPEETKTTYETSPVQQASPVASSTPDRARESLFNWIENERGTQEVSSEDYTDRYLSVEELYDVLALRSKKTDTIYLIEDYLKTIPDSLPDESRRQIVAKIVASSGFDYDLLMGDGILRVKMLKEYAEKFARHTEDYVAAHQAEIFELENKIVQIHNLIEKRRELHKKQFLSIEAEAGRLREILAFING